MAILGEHVARDLRTELYEHLAEALAGLLLAQEDRQPDHARHASDTDRLWEFLALGVVDVSLAIIMLIGLSGSC